ncbi:unnamed protein product [Pleuronectes platessa]|uniref:Uncharacterized protein n=1 Tax=Pleuronectes platessa TaxID=8262 RepID=A0A9N7YI56_PLEPL|nr:unnamed protein product [Pleuronectes platessa]
MSPFFLLLLRELPFPASEDDSALVQLLRTDKQDSELRAAKHRPPTLAQNPPCGPAQPSTVAQKWTNKRLQLDKLPDDQSKRTRSPPHTFHSPASSCPPLFHLIPCQFFLPPSSSIPVTPSSILLTPPLPNPSLSPPPPRSPCSRSLSLSGSLCACMTPLSPSELLPLREADGPGKGSNTGTIQRLQIRCSTKNIATGSKGDEKGGEKRDRDSWE